MQFRQFVCELSVNPLRVPAMAPHWSLTQRVMSEVLMQEGTRRHIWDQRAEVLDTIARGQPGEAKRQARRHSVQSARVMLAPLRSAEACAHTGADTDSAWTAAAHPVPASARGRAQARDNGRDS